MRYVHKGRSGTLTPQHVQRALQGVEPETVRMHWVEVNGVRYPVNQAFEVSTGAHRSSFNTDLARRTFTRLGLRVGRARGSARFSGPPQVPAVAPEVDSAELSEAAAELAVFLREQSLSEALGETEESLVGADRDSVREVREQVSATRPMVQLTTMLLRDRSKLRRVWHASTLMLAMEAILEDGEEIAHQPSLLSIPGRGGFDLSTTRRVANFVLGQIDTDTQQRTVLQRYVELAMESSDRVAQLWLADPVRGAFLWECEQPMEWGLARSSQAVRDRFRRRFGPLHVSVAEFCAVRAQHVQVRDLRPVLARIDY